MGMVHDGVQNQCSRSCCLMSAVNGAGKTTWSECSVREFNAFLLQLEWVLFYSSCWSASQPSTLASLAEGIVFATRLPDSPSTIICPTAVCPVRGTLRISSAPISGEESTKSKSPRDEPWMIFAEFSGVATGVRRFQLRTLRWREVGAVTTRWGGFDRLKI